MSVLQKSGFLIKNLFWCGTPCVILTKNWYSHEKYICILINFINTFEKHSNKGVINRITICYYISHIQKVKHSHSHTMNLWHNLSGDTFISWFFRETAFLVRVFVRTIKIIFVYLFKHFSSAVDVSDNVIGILCSAWLCVRYSIVFINSLSF